MRRHTLSVLIILTIPILLGFAGTAVQGWHEVFDDAFITYRYSKNLALGHGITWNPGEPPTEGYTNFLLVLILAPFIKAGFDPLIVTRIVSYFCTFAMAAVFFSTARHRHGCTTPASMMLASLVFLVPQTRELCLVGLETVVYALFLLLTFLQGVEFLRSHRTRDSMILSLMIILTMLLRPEAALIYPVLALLYWIHPAPAQQTKWRPFLLGLLGLLLPGGLYLLWKLVHFGYLLPNPYYLKAAGESLITPSGVDSVTTFIHTNALYLVMAFINLMFLMNERRKRGAGDWIASLTGWGLVILYSGYFLTVDTLMDIHGRFMYPMVPILIHISIPVLAASLKTVESLAQGGILRYSAIAVGFLLVFGMQDFLQVREHAVNLVPKNDWQASDSLMQKEYRIARSLAAFPGIEHTRIAWGDAGVMPYFTGAIWLDDVGLNDTYLSRVRNKRDAIYYYFQWQPDLAILASNKDHTWVTYGHGPLGNFRSWADDTRWDEYQYVGTSRTSGEIYDLQYFVRKSGPVHDALKEFLQTSVVDGWYDPMPFSIGSQVPIDGRQPEWIPRNNPAED